MPQPSVPTPHAVQAILLAAGLAFAAPALAQDASQSDSTAGIASIKAPPAPAAPAPLTPGIQDGEPRSVSAINIAYAQDHPEHPAPEALLNTTVNLVATPTGYIQPRDGDPGTPIPLSQIGTTPTPLYDSALLAISQALLANLRDQGLISIFVEPDPNQFRTEDGAIVDARPNQAGDITFIIYTGVVSEVRTVAQGDRVTQEGDQPLDHPLHLWIRDNSPLRAATESARGSLLRGDALNDYVYRLNRHPGRRVDVAVAATGEAPGAVALDYLVTENKPWFVFGQLSNTGSEGTGAWRERFGFIHNQLTNNDDSFSIEYTTSNFDESNAVFASYTRPISANRRLKARAYGSWYEYTASDVGQLDADFSGTGYSVGGELIWNFYQDRDAFLDAFAGVRFERVEIDNELALLKEDENFVIGTAGLRFERLRDTQRTTASAAMEYSFNGVSSENTNRLGRFETSEHWTAFQGSLEHSFYLENIFDNDLADNATLAHEISLSARGQYAFNSRLAPNFQQVAGGLYSVRGYDESVTAGDNAVIGSIEYRYHIPRDFAPNPEAGELFGKPFRWAPQYPYGPVDWDLILKAFLDVGHTSSSQRVNAIERDQFLMGIGLGAELAISRNFNLRVDWGVALRDVEDAAGQIEVDEGDSRLHLVLTVLF